MRSPFDLPQVLLNDLKLLIVYFLVSVDLIMTLETLIPQ